MRALARELAEIARIAGHFRPARRLARLAVEAITLAAFIAVLSGAAVLATTDAPTPRAVMIAEAGR